MSEEKSAQLKKMNTKQQVLSLYENIKKTASAMLEVFVTDDGVRKTRFQCATNMRRFLVKQRQDEIRSIEEILSRFQVKVKKSDSEEDFVLTGTPKGLALAQEMLESLTWLAVSSEKLRIAQPGLHRLIRDGRGQNMVQTVEREHECAIEVQHNLSEIEGTSAGEENFESDQESDDDFDLDGDVRLTPSVTFAVGNCRITWKAEKITEEQGDSLVSFEEEHRRNKAQAADLAMRGAPALRQSEDVTITAGLKLACSHVVNTRCYDYDGPGGTAGWILRNIVKKSLAEAVGLQQNSVDFPVLGTGKLGFPPDVASRIMLQEALQFCQTNQSTSITDVHFVVFMEDQVLIGACEKAMAAMLEMYRSGRTTSLVADGRKSIQICVTQGDITQEQTDAIVNINSTDMNLHNAGALSKAVAKASGPALQRECRNQGQQQPGAAVMTSGEKLAVPYIIHSIPGSANKQHLQQCVETCLRLADSAGLQSVSLPAFGTGGFGISAQCSANLIFQALDKFSPTNQNIRQVNIVIFQQTMLQTFTQEQEKRAGVVTASTRCPPIPLPLPLASRVSRGVRARNRAPANTWKNDQVVTFCVLGKNEEKTKKAIEELTKGFSAAYKVKTVEDKAIKLLPKLQISQLMRRATSLDVALSVKPRMGQITVRGDSNDVLTLVEDIWAKLKVVKDDEQAKLVSKTVQWHYTTLGVKKPFDEGLNLELEIAHSNNKPKVTFFLLGERYSLSFRNKTGTGQTTGEQITVSREVLGASSNGIPLPSHWDPMPRDPQTGNDVTVHLVYLWPGSLEYQTVVQKLQNTGGHVNIQRIQRVQNPYLYQTYMVRKQKMDKDNGGQINERQLFHGTAAANVAKINTQGFDKNFAGKNGKAYGAGVYFARDASFSLNYASGNAGSKPMYIAQVLVGQYVLGNSSMMVPPPKNASRPEITFDSTVDNAYNPSIFVVFHDNQCYPEYLITF